MLTVHNYPGKFVDVSVDGRVCGLDAAGKPTCFDAYSAPLPPGPFVQFLPSQGDDWCGLDAEGRLTCLGSQDLYAVAPPFYGGLVSLHASQGWACGVRPDGRATCWSIFDLDQPPQDQVFLEVVGGQNVGCGIKPDHRVYCWGESANYGFPEEQ
jgi:hypothetical protein